MLEPDRGLADEPNPTPRRRPKARVLVPLGVATFGVLAATAAFAANQPPSHRSASIEDEPPANCTGAAAYEYDCEHVVSATVSSTTPKVGSKVTITGHVAFGISSSDRPVANALVRARVRSGDNPIDVSLPCKPSSCLTDKKGNIQFTATSDTAETDTVTVWSDLNGNQLFDDDEEGDSVTINWTKPPSKPKPTSCTAPKATGNDISVFTFGDKPQTGTTANFQVAVGPKLKAGPMGLAKPSTQSSFVPPQTNVTLRVECGPNAGHTETQQTSPLGSVLFGYKGAAHEGTDQVSFSFTDSSGKTERAITKVKWKLPPPKIDPCAPVNRGTIGDNLVAAIQCSATKTIQDVQCGLSVSGLLFTPSKVIDGAVGADGLIDLTKMAPEFVSVGKFYNDLAQAHFLPTAPKSLKTFKDLLKRAEEADHGYSAIKILPDYKQAVADGDWQKIAIDLSEIVGLKPCVQNLIAAVTQS